MDKPATNQPSLAERLAPLCEMLTSPAAGPNAFAAAQQELRHVAGVLGDASAGDWAEAAAVLGDLAEIAGCSLAEQNGDEGSRLVECIVQGIALLREAVDRPDAPNDSLEGFLASARRDWSDCLAVIDRVETEPGTEWPAPHDRSAEAAPSSAEVRMILSSLAGETSGSSVSSGLFDPKISESGKLVPPPALTAVDEVELEPELLDAYLYDAVQCLGSMEQAVLQFESGGGDAAVQRLCRELHTLKGASASVGLESLGSYLHEVEEWLEQAGSPGNLDAVLACIDVVRSWIDQCQRPADSDDNAIAAGTSRALPSTAAAQSPVAAASPNPRIVTQSPLRATDVVARPSGPDVVARSPDRATFATPAVAQSPDRAAPVVARSPDRATFATEGLPLAAPKNLAATVTLQPPQKSAAALTTSSEAAGDVEDSLRVKASQVDHLMDLLADMVMLRSRRDRHAARLADVHEELRGCVSRLQAVSNHTDMLEQAPADAADRPAVEQLSQRKGHLAEIAGDLTEAARALKELHDPIVEENRTISQFIRQFRHELMELRRMPVAGLFRRLQRAVRDAARVENKQVRLEMVGEHAGLERSLQERLYEPLLHLVRNAVGHGIEAAADRAAAGKQAVGTITLEALGSAQMLVLEIRDDGRGLDYDAIRRRGIERGLISPDQQASPAQLAQLIFHPGFSTREQANAVAGRGVGMDVVASSLRRMHARIDIESETGRGTTVRLRIPLRSVIEHTMVFRCSGQLFALPVQSVRAVSESEWRETQHDPAADVLLRLADVLGLPCRPDAEGGHCLVLGQANLPGARRQTAGLVAMQVDEILGPDEVVVRSLPPLLRRHPLLAGATLSGGGDVVQLLDSERLIEACLASTQRAALPAADEAPAAAERPVRQETRVLVVDDSLSARRSLVQKLRRLGFDLYEAGDGFEALDRLRSEHFDLIFSDLEMPRMGGFDLLAEIRSNRRTRSLPVVIVTTRGEAEFRARAAQLGGDGYLTKPVSAIDLEQLLEQLDISPTTDNPKGLHE